MQMECSQLKIQAHEFACGSSKENTTLLQKHSTLELCCRAYCMPHFLMCDDRYGSCPHANIYLSCHCLSSQTFNNASQIWLLSQIDHHDSCIGIMGFMAWRFLNDAYIHTGGMMGFDKAARYTLLVHSTLNHNYDDAKFCINLSLLMLATSPVIRHVEALFMMCLVVCLHPKPRAPSLLDARVRHGHM